MHWSIRYRNYTVAFILGGSVCAVGAYNWEHANTEHVINLGLKGGCPGLDMDKGLYWFPCKDSYIAAQIAQHAEEVDAEATAILNDMEKHQPRAKVTKVKGGTQ